MAAPGAKTDHALWRFAVALYAKPSVARACMHLQDDHGLDVCMLLACLWYARERSRALEPARLRELRHRVAPIADWTARLRVLRRELEHTAQRDPTWRGLHQQAKTTELDAEALELTLLYDALAADPPGNLTAVVAAEASLFRYAELEGAAGAEPLLDALVADLGADGGSSAGRPSGPTY